MKNLIPNKRTLCRSLILICLLAASTGCFWKGNKTKTAKISNPESVSSTCAKNAGLDEKDTSALKAAIKHYDGEFTDEFKLNAMSIIANSHTVNPKQRNSVTKEYLSCVEGNTAQKK
ncbi:MAG: hypothetical protein ACHQ6U_07525 [Thermodesulfobacteriota bacterium]|jgi:hypothetical protein